MYLAIGAVKNIERGIKTIPKVMHVPGIVILQSTYLYGVGLVLCGVYFLTCSSRSGSPIHHKTRNSNKIPLFKAVFDLVVFVLLLLPKKLTGAI